MKKRFLLAAALLALLSALNSQLSTLWAQGTAFTYQGLLQVNGSAANGSYDMTFAIFDHESGAAQIGATVTNSPTAVSNGLFTVTLDFGPGIFTGPARWLEIGSRPTGSGADFVILATRQELTPAPYAIFAATTSQLPNNSVTASNLAANAITAPSIANGTVVRSLNGLSDLVNLSAGANVSITTAGNNVQISASGSGGIVLPFNATYASANPLFSVNNTGGGTGVAGVGDDKGVYGSTGTAGTTHAGVFGENSAAGGTAVIGNALNTNSAGVAGIADTAGSTGVYGRGDSAGISGYSLFGSGVHGESDSPSGIGVFGVNSSGSGVAGFSDYGYGVYGRSFYGGEAGHFDGDVGVTGNESFGNTTRQMLNLYGTGYGVGVQNYTLYERSAGGFAWYNGGTHTNSQNDAGGGNTLMTLDVNGNLSVNLASNQVVKSLNGLKDNVTLMAGPNIALQPDPSGHGLQISAGGDGNFALSATNYSTYSWRNYNADALMTLDDLTLSVAGGVTAAGGVTGASGQFGGTPVTSLPCFPGLTGRSPSETCDGVYGESIDASGVRGTTGTGKSTSAGVYGENTGTGTGVKGTSIGGDGVSGVAHANGGSGVSGFTDNANGYAGYFKNQGSGGQALHAEGAVYINGIATINGSATVNCLTINGGCDVAEPFRMSAREIPKGAVVVIDDENAGQLKLSDRAYDTRVAGIVSGANGINPGVSLSQQGVLEGGQNVALSGRVYVLADASSGPIKPGDLLTTSDVPGHAMRAGDPSRAQGAILGKAMSPLTQGKGMVLVLVSLQ